MLVKTLNYLLVIQCGEFIGLITAPDVNLEEKVILFLSRVM